MKSKKKTAPARNESFELMDGILSFLDQSDMWFRVFQEDLRLRAAERAMYGLLDQLKDQLSPTMGLALDEAVADYTIASMQAAMLFGMRIQLAVQDAARAPAEYAHYIYDRDRAAGR